MGFICKWLYSILVTLNLRLFPALNSDGRQEGVCFDKITSRIQKLCYGLNNEFVDPVSSYLSSLKIVNLSILFNE